jgi:hypothetical protein
MFIQLLIFSEDDIVNVSLHNKLKVGYFKMQKVGQGKNRGRREYKSPFTQHKNKKKQSQCKDFIDQIMSNKLHLAHSLFV